MKKTMKRLLDGYGLPAIVTLMATRFPGAAPIFEQAQHLFGHSGTAFDNAWPHKNDSKERWSAMPTDWPQPGGRDFRPAETGLFLTRSFRKQFTPGDVIEIRVARSKASEQLAKRVRIPLAIILIEGNLPIDVRIAASDAGSCWSFLNFAGSTQALTMQSLHAAEPSRGSPVSVNDDSIFVRLPSTMGPADFITAFENEIRKAEIGRWAATGAGAAHCAAVGVAPSTVCRLARDAAHGEGVVATEAVAFRPRADPTRLIAIAEQIVLRHLGLTG